MTLKDVLFSVMANKCPRCHKGNFFENNNPYNFRNGLTMNVHCPECGLRYERETGYFYGAMFVSYALQVGLFILLYTLNTFWWKLEAPIIISIISILAFAVFPFTFRHSRIFWVAMFTKYEPGYTKITTPKDIDITIK
ncbi:MAG TPA: DUF983 domain-containing protein [Bacteroidia bacterium]|jgi:uncharacterized protein (DUF983 family)|nr:DUF983 domain-containing protein [Bacteroidia bacterium]